MGSAAILDENFAANAVLSGGNWRTALPLDNLKDLDIGTVARSQTAAAADTEIDIDLGGSKPVGGIILGPLNATPGSGYRIKAFSDAAMTSVVYDSTGLTFSGEVFNWNDTSTWLPYEDQNFWSAIIPSDYDELPQYLVHIVPAASASAATARYWKLNLTDESNGDGALSAGFLGLFRVYRPSLNYAPDSNSFDMAFISDVSESLAGSRVWGVRNMRRSYRLQWPSLDETEADADWFRMALRSRVDRPVFVIPDEAADQTALRKFAILATLKQAPSIVRANVSRAALVLDAEEVL